MNTYTDNYSLLLNKIDEFTRKFYLNQLLRGVIYSVAFALIFFLSLNFLEYKFYFSTVIRKIFLDGFLLGNVFILGKWVAIPLLHYHRLGKVISKEKAAEIIGKRFQNVEDKLINILQLKENTSYFNAELINASINQKIKELKPIPFSAAIDLSQNKKYLKYALAPLLIFVVVLFSAPNIIKESSKRIIYSSTEFEKPAPFHFEILNEKLEALQYDDYTLEVKVNGDVLPNEIFIEQNNYKYKLEKRNINNFVYKFNKLQKDVEFNLSADNVYSKDYELKVLVKPVILSFDAVLQYPKYIGKQDESLKNIGDLVIPQGTKVNWYFSTQNTKTINVKFDNDTMLSATLNEKDGFVLNRHFMKGNQYTIYVSNENVQNADSIGYSVTVIPDLYPIINVTTLADSINKKSIYFVGDASDDYGLKNIYFKYEIQGEGKQKNVVAIPISIAPNTKNTRYNYYWDLSQAKLSPGDKVIYYFETWDNDGVNGSKFSRSSAMIFNMPSEKEFEIQLAKTNEAIKSNLEKSIQEAEKIKEDVKTLQEKLLQKKNADWEDKQTLQKLIEQQEHLQNQVKDIQDKYNEQLSKQGDYKEVNERIQEKQKQLQDIFNSALPEDMKKKMEELQTLMDKLNKQQTMEEMKNLQMNNEQLEKTLDRMLALFKQMEFEAKLQETIDDLKKLSMEQIQLKNKTEESKSTESEQLKEEQKSVNEKFDDIEKKMSELQKKDEELKQQNSFDNKTKEQKEEVKNELKKSMNSLEQKKNKKASESQEKAADDMREMAEQMQAMMLKAEEEQLGEDMKSVRQLLKNLVKLSFDQEELMNLVKIVNINSPQYVSNMKSQQKIKDDMKMVKDSLFSLAKRQINIESYVLNQTKDIDKNMDKGIYALEQRQTPQAASYQQYIMTATNNLALILSEALAKMQQQEKDCKNGSCSKPGGKGKKSANALSMMQKDLNDQLKKIKEGLKPGEKPGEKAGLGKQGMSKELAQLAAQQAAIRQALEKLNLEDNKDGKGSLGNLQQLAKEMEQTETDLLNKKITEEIINRQQEILTRLLDAANAERQRETDPKREAERPKEYAKKIPPSLEEYLKKREAEIELYKSVPPNLKPYYKNMVEQYFKNISF